MRRYTILIVAFCVFALFMEVSHAQVKLYSSTGSKEYSDEKISLVKNGNPGQKQAAGVIAALLPTALKSGLTITKNALKNREQKFVAEYETQLVADNLFAAHGKINLQNIKLTRKYEGDTKTGLEALFDVETNSDKTAFRYKVNKIDLDLSKAKLKGGDQLDMKFEISFHVMTTKDGKKEFALVDTHSISVTGVSLKANYSEEVSSAWFPIPKLPLSVTVAPGKKKKLTLDEFYKEVTDLGLTAEEGLKAKWILTEEAIVAGTNNYYYVRYIKQNDSTYFKLFGEMEAGGSYKIHIKVKEANPRQLKSQRLAKFFEDNSESITNVTDAAIGFFFKEEEEDSENNQ